MPDRGKLLVYVVDDDETVRRSLCALLRSHGYEAFPCASAEEFLDVFDSEREACLLLDVRMPGLNGMDLQARLKALGQPVPVVILTAHGTVQRAVRALKHGAIDFIEKPAREEELLAAIEAARAARASQPRRIVPPDQVAKRLARLTAREREVLDHLVLGRTNKEIAAALGISQRTVEIHRARIRQKMEAQSVADLIMMMR